MGNGPYHVLGITAPLSHYAIGKGQASLRHPVGLLADPDSVSSRFYAPFALPVCSAENPANDGQLHDTAATKSVAFSQSIL